MRIVKRRCRPAAHLYLKRPPKIGIFAIFFRGRKKNYVMTRFYKKLILVMRSRFAAKTGYLKVTVSSVNSKVQNIILSNAILILSGKEKLKINAFTN